MKISHIHFNYIRSQRQSINNQSTHAHTKAIFYISTAKEIRADTARRLNEKALGREEKRGIKRVSRRRV